jgi:adenosylcobyric acid synthase
MEGRGEAPCVDTNVDAADTSARATKRSGAPVTKPVFIGGTSSHAGKSWMTTAICAWLHRRGVRVAPFKAQNMSNNSYPCRAGGEIGRAQAAQAWACGLDPEPAMNPILLKPNSDGGSQVVVNGKVWKNLSAREYYDHHDVLREIVFHAYEQLAARFDVIVIEGAGSVAELNLRSFDLANLGLATRLSAPWLLVGDIERGGIFASIIGTVGLLTPEERRLLRAFAVNKFRGDRTLFHEGQQIIEERTSVPCLGVFPYAGDIHLDDEDSLSIPERSDRPSSGQACAIIRFPRISNSTDFRLLPDACWITESIDRNFDFIFLPGTKNTIGDLEWLRSQRLDQWLSTQYSSGATLIGVCGGFQMLGQSIHDPGGLESSSAHAPGLALLPMTTTMGREKTTRAIQARTPQGHSFQGYEIHLGETAWEGSDRSPFAILGDHSTEGVRAERIIGTYLHGAFEDPQVLAEIGITAAAGVPRDFERLADWFAPFGTRFEELFL